MLTDTNRSELFAAKSKYEASVNRGSGVRDAKDGLKNVMFNCYPDLISLAMDSSGMVSEAEKMADDLKARIAELENEVAMLNQSLSESDAENNEMRRELRRLQESRDKPKVKAVAGDAKEEP